MADVRLTATNPEDSSVVPVACNEKGELKLEEPLVVEGPPGEKGDKGDKGDSGDPFSGNFVGDVFFDGNVGINQPEPQNVLSARNGDIALISGYNLYGAGQCIRFFANGVDNESDNFAEIRGGLTGAGTSPQRGYLAFYTSGSECLRIDPEGNFNIGASPASPKAGFTKEGYLWCTTERGDTIKLVGSSNGMAIWENYNPLVERAWDEKDVIRPMPEESSLDEPETPQ